MFNFAPEIKEIMTISNIDIEDGVVFLDNLKDVRNLSTMRQSFNSIVYCRRGRIMVEMGGNQQIKVTPGQMLLIPTGKVIQPLMVSTDIEANALLISDQKLKGILGNQLNIWNKAMYMKEIYVIEETSWINDMGSYTRSIFKHVKGPELYQEIQNSFLRTMLLMICEELMQHDSMSANGDVSSAHDKEIFNRFLQMLNDEKLKRQQVSVYADKLNISAKYLSTICKKVNGKNPMRWITEYVMEDCYRHLRSSDLSVKEIADELGFPNASFFGQYFREQAGMTPGAYRNKHRNV